jgi:hypothetical protein
MIYTIYKTTNLINKKFYIGKHQTNNPQDNYLGSGKALLDAILKYGKENFKKEVLFEYDNEASMNQKEKEIITEEFVNRPDTYNIGIGGEGGPHFKGKTHTKDVIERIRKKLTGHPSLVEYGRKIGKLSKGRKLSQQAKENIANGKRLGKRLKMKDETKKKISETLKGKKNTLISKKLIGNKNAQVMKTDEAKARHSEIMKRAWEKRKLKESN